MKYLHRLPVYEGGLKPHGPRRHLKMIDYSVSDLLEKTPDWLVEAWEKKNCKGRSIREVNIEYKANLHSSFMKGRLILIAACFIAAILCTVLFASEKKLLTFIWFCLFFTLPVLIRLAFEAEWKKKLYEKNIPACGVLNKFRQDVEEITKLMGHYRNMNLRDLTMKKLGDWAVYIAREVREKEIWIDKARFNKKVSRGDLKDVAVKLDGVQHELSLVHLRFAYNFGVIIELGRAFGKAEKQILAPSGEDLDEQPIVTRI